MTWVALLRAVNLGRHRKLPMSDLRELLEALGYADVRTHLQSGNAIFVTGRTSARAIERQVEARIELETKMKVKVLVRSSSELGEIVDANPFVASGVPARELMVTFLATAPPTARIEDLGPAAFLPDRFEFGSRVLYLHSPNGFLASRLPDWERVLGVTATTRTWRTVSRLAELVEVSPRN